MIIETEQHDAVRLLRWTDGDNRLHRRSVDAWNGALDDLEAVDGPVAAVIAGSGKFFSNGLDLDWMSSGEEDSGPFLADVHRLFGRLLVCPVYVVGAVVGHAFAGGAMLSLCLDTLVMRTERGYWCLPEADLGLPLTDEMATVVTAALPRTTAREAIVTGRRYDAAAALAAGIVSHTAPEHEVVATAISLAAAMAPKDRSTLATHKRWLYGDAARRCGWAV